ncbi:MAG: metal-dependent hydrolase [Verrucomicrobiales bacterium]|nr:metal-dependent hydrolase [Verrucomicrobiota bacterium JB025]
MDSLTQATLGAAVGELILGKRIGNRAIAWGAFFGTLPDLDILFNPLFDTAGKLWWHRGPSHSLLVMCLASWLLAKPLARLWKTRKKSEQITARRAAWFVFAVWSTHVLIDCFTVYGTSVFWPLPVDRVAFNNLFIIDPLFTAPMLVALVWLAFLKTKKQVPKRRRLNAWGLGLASAYVLLSFTFKHLAARGFDADLAARGATPQRRIEAPTPFNIILWRSVADMGDELWVGYRSILDFDEKPVRWTIYPKGKAAFAPHADLREAERLDWFSDGWWIARPHVKGVWIADMRFGETRIHDPDDGRVDTRPVFSWDINLQARGDRLEPLPMKRPEVSESLKRVALRALATRDAWQGYPRLTGITGSFPELLRVAD